MAKEGFDTVKRRATDGSVLKRKLVEDQDRAIFMQGGAPLQTTQATQQWRRNNFYQCLEKVI